MLSSANLVKKGEIVYCMNAFFLLIMVVEWVGVLPDSDECHDGTLEQFDKFKVKVYTGVHGSNLQKFV